MAKKKIGDYELDVTCLDDLKEIIDAMDSRSLDKLQRAALSRAARVIYDATKGAALGMEPKFGNTNPQYNDKIIDGVRMTLKQDSTNNWLAKVHILVTRKTGSQSYKLRFFEKGTEPRKTRQGYNRGQIKALNFFSGAVNSTYNSAVSRLEDDFITEVEKYIDSKIK